MDERTKSELVTYLRSFATKERLEKMDAALAQRTRYLSIAVEDVFDPHNSSAVIRSAESFGVQNVSIIENRNRFRLSSQVSRGTYKWITLKRYHEKGVNNTETAFRDFRKAGYTIWAASPRNDSRPLAEIDFSRPTLLLFGSESDGLTPYALEHSDHRFHIPMHGFAESLNLSVSAAIVLYTLRQKLNNSDIAWQLSESDRNEIMLSWMGRSIRSYREQVDRFLKTKNREQG